MADKKIRVLHVVGGMNRGGVETWLMHVFRHIDRKRFEFDFLVHTNAPCAFDNEIRDLGGKIIFCAGFNRPWQYARNFRLLLYKNGPYDVVHSHVHHYSGFVLNLAQSVGVPVRIAHSHTDTSLKNNAATLFRSAYLKLMKFWIWRYATVRIACSHQAAAALFGIDRIKDSRWRLHYYGIDMKPFLKAATKKSMRSILGIKPGALVVGHVGSFSEPKNHQFLIEIFREIVKRESKAMLLLVGRGPRLNRIEEQIEKYGLGANIIFAGSEVDVPRVMTESMDVFVFPSIWEGMPLALIEAQAANLPIVISDTITKEVYVEPQLVCRLSLKNPPEIWAEKAIMAAKNHLVSNDEIGEILEQCHFNIKKSLQGLIQVYDA